MKIKGHIYILLILLVCIISISAVSATDDTASDIISTNDNEEIVLDDNLNDDVISTDNSEDGKLLLEDNTEELISNENEKPLSEPDDGTFQALQNKINAGYGTTITLENDYKCEDGFNREGIEIANAITIDGKGHKIDAQGKGRIFKVNIYCDNVILKNITFLNGNNALGGAISFDSDNKNCLVSNCTFINNNAVVGGAIRANDYLNILISDCYFVNNSADVWGGGIHMVSTDNIGNVTNCTFENNHANKGGAICSELWAKIYSYSCISKTSSDNTFNVINHPPTLDVNNITAAQETGEKITLNLTTYDGIQLTGTNITINIYYKNNDSWVAKYEYQSGDEWQVILPTGTYIAKFSTEYTGFDQSISITIKNGTELTATEVTTTYNVNKDLEITLKDKQGNPLSNMEITVDLNGSKNYTTDPNGQITIPTKDLAAGIYTAKINFTGTETYMASSTSTTVTISKDSPKLTASAVTTTYNVAKNLVITLKDSTGKALSGVEVIAKIGSTTKKAKTDQNGQAKINVAKLLPKTYTAQISFAGDANYNAASTTAKVTVKKATPKLTAKAKTFKFEDKTKKYTISLKDNKGKALKNKKITLKVKGKTYTAKTNSKGVATFKLNKLTKKGKFNAAITYAGDKYYNKISKKAKITVKAPAWKTVSKGSKNKATVRKIQQALKDNGYYLTYKGHYLKIDGIYKGCTERSVKEFQKDKGLKVTGKVDEKTAKKLKLI
jgi:predicted outer membrane repeat protein